MIKLLITDGKARSIVTVFRPLLRKKNMISTVRGRPAQRPGEATERYFGCTPGNASAMNDTSASSRSLEWETSGT
jgi:hypothetical protein